MVYTYGGKNLKKKTPEGEKLEEQKKVVMMYRF